MIKAKRGRPTKLPEDRVNHDGIFERQWERIGKEAKARHLEPHQMLRWIIDDWFGVQDAQREDSPFTTQRDYKKFEQTIKTYKQGE